MAAGAQWPVFQAPVPLEQQRHRRVPDLFVVVVGRDQGDAAGGFTDPGDDGGEHVGQFRGDDQEPFGVGLGRGDLQQRNQFAGGGKPVLDQAVMAEFGQLLNTDSGEPQDFDGGPGPKGAGRSSGSRSRRLPVSGSSAHSWPAVSGVRSTAPQRVCSPAVNSWPGAAASAAASDCVARRAPVLGGRDQGGQHRQTLAGALVHPRFAAAAVLLAAAVSSPSRIGQGATHGPQREGSSVAHWAMSR